MIVERIQALVEQGEQAEQANQAGRGEPAPDPNFEELALEAFAFQFENVEPYRGLCRAREAVPGTVSDWRQVPPVPTSAFKTLSLALAVSPAREVFRSSGTTAGRERSVHHHPFPDLYRRTIDRSFPAFCLGGMERPPMLSLIPSRDQLPDSSLSFMIDHVLDRHGGEGSIQALGSKRLDLTACRSWLGARQRGSRPGVILGTAFALVELLDGLDRLGLRFRLPAGTVVFETGGYKGRTREVGREELLTTIRERLGVPSFSVVGEYGMTELTSQLYTANLRGGEEGLFVAPPWVRVRVLDPETLEEAEPGTVGLIAIFDLANVGSAMHLLTEDLGRAEEGGLRLLGRAAGAELRGCSLTVEEMAG